MRLSDKDEKKREQILHGNLWHVLLQIGIPLALFQGLNQLFKILDTLMAASISPISVSAVAYLSQINMLLSAVGGGLAIGASIKISEACGAGEYDLVRHRVSSLLVMSGILAAFAFALIPFTVPFLKMTGTPEDFIGEGAAYFAVSLADVALTFWNTAYVAIERARGNTGRILWMNLASVAIKLGLTALFVFVLHQGVVMIAVATVASDLVLTVACFYFLFIRSRGDAFGFSRRSVSWSRKVVRPMLHVGFPVMVEKVAFSLGKVLINAMATMYGSLTVGALGISNNIGGITTNPQNGFEDAGSAVISQNLGAGQPERARQAFWHLCAINCAIGGIGFILTMLLLQPISGLFAPSDPSFAALIAQIYRFEAMGLIPLGIASAVMSLLYGFGYTKLTLILNFCRVFVLRVPVLWGLQNWTTLGSQSVGIVMMVSNIGTGVLSLMVGLYVLHRIKEEYHADSWSTGA